MASLLPLLSQLPSAQKKELQAMIDNLKEAFASMALRRLQLTFDDDAADREEDEAFSFEPLRDYLLNCGITDITDDMMNDLITQAIETSEPPPQSSGETIATNDLPPENPDLFGWEDWSTHGVHENITPILLKNIDDPPIMVEEDGVEDDGSFPTGLKAWKKKPLRPKKGKVNPKEQRTNPREQKRKKQEERSSRLNPTAIQHFSSQMQSSQRQHEPLAPSHSGAAGPNKLKSLSKRFLHVGDVSAKEIGDDRYPVSAKKGTRTKDIDDLKMISATNSEEGPDEDIDNLEHHRLKKEGEHCEHIRKHRSHRKTLRTEYCGLQQFRDPFHPPRRPTIKPGALPTLDKTWVWRPIKPVILPVVAGQTHNLNDIVNSILVGKRRVRE
ncbi:hypothetical protein HDU67_007987 [Dinochytrium kinnereticum]|nr:hypothetical protein HDU67_007987 [Dinochytrium kinnereticum]